MRQQCLNAAGTAQMQTHCSILSQDAQSCPSRVRLKIAICGSQQNADKHKIASTSACQPSADQHRPKQLGDNRNLCSVLQHVAWPSRPSNKCHIRALNAPEGTGQASKKLKATQMVIQKAKALNLSRPPTDQQNRMEGQLQLIHVRSAHGAFDTLLQ